MLESVQIKQSGDSWAAYVGDRQVTKRLCKSCIIRIILKMTSKSYRYNQVIVFNEDGTQTVHTTGVVDAGKAEETR